MIWGAVKRVFATDLIASVILAAIALLLISVGIHSVPWPLYLAASVAVVLVVYRLRYKRL